MQEIDLQELFFIIMRRIWIVFLSIVVLCAGAVAVTHYSITPKYTASIKLYVNNSTEVNTDITSSDVSASQSLVDTYITILQSNTVLNNVISNTGVSYSTKQLSGMISAKAINNTEVFQVSVVSSSPEEAQLIANTIADVAPVFLSEIVSGSSVKIVDRAQLPTAPSSPNYMKNAAIGALLGLVLSCAIIILLALLDTHINNEADLARISPLPVLGAITQFGNQSRSPYGNTLDGSEVNENEKQ